MTKIVKLASLSTAAILSVALLGGCTDQTARDTAQQALDTANVRNPAAPPARAAGSDVSEDQGRVRPVAGMIPASYHLRDAGIFLHRSLHARPVNHNPPHVAAFQE